MFFGGRADGDVQEPSAADIALAALALNKGVVAADAARLVRCVEKGVVLVWHPSGLL